MDKLKLTSPKSVYQCRKQPVSTPDISYISYSLYQLPDISTTYKSCKKDISSLDLNVLLGKNKLSTDLHIKPTDCHQYLHYSSGHPEHTKLSIVYSLLLRVNWICSSENDFDRHKSNMKIWFQKRGYPENIIENEMKKVNFPSCIKVQRKKSKGIPFVVTYHHLLKQLEEILPRNKYLFNKCLPLSQWSRTEVLEN